MKLLDRLRRVDGQSTISDTLKVLFRGYTIPLKKVCPSDRYYCYPNHRCFVQYNYMAGAQCRGPIQPEEEE